VVSFLVTAPILVPLATALLTALYAGRPRAQQAMSLAGALLLLASALALAIQVQGGEAVRLTLGGWAVPFAIELVADRIGAAMTLVAAVMGVAALVFQLSDADPAPLSPALYPLVHALLAGVGGAFLTADLFNLYVWLEVMLIASLGLLAHGTAKRHLEATLKYFVLNVFGTLLILMSVAFLYAVTGHLNYSAIERASSAIDPTFLLPFVAALTVALLIKCGAFPLFAWLPAAYHTLPAPILALFAALTTKVAVYALLRLLGGVFFRAPAALFEALGWIAVATMLAGVMGAAYHWDMRRILAFHIVSQIGYMLLGIALATPTGDLGTIFYVIHHILVKANLFLIAAIVFRLTGSYDLRRIGGLYAAKPWISVLFLVPALSLVGIPPLSGFWAKFILVRESLALGHGVWAAAALLVGFLTLYSMTKIWSEAFWKDHPREDWRPAEDARLTPALAVTCGLAALTLVLGAWPEPFVRYARVAAEVLRAGGGS